MSIEKLLEKTGAAALVLRQELVPVEGRDGVFFPATFAKSEDGTFPGGYNIDFLGKDDKGNEKNVCLIDTVGSQANRTEPLFADGVYAALVPQIVVTAGERKVNLLSAGHRAGDAIVRCSSLQTELQAAFKALLGGNAEPLAKVAPTSLVFGVWDSRDTQAKAPRLLASTVRAYDVRVLTRSAQYVPAIEFVDEGLLEEPADKKAQAAYSSRGFIHVPAPHTHGGVMSNGGIRREATLQLAALRALSASTPEQTAKLREYLLGLALTAFTAPAGGYLRQGCNLVPAEGTSATVTEVGADGKRSPFPLDHPAALAFAKKAAAAFGVGPSKEVPFDRELAKKDLAEDDAKKAAKAAKKAAKNKTGK